MIDIAVLEKLNAPTREERLANLAALLPETEFPPMVPEYINNHIHTTYSDGKEARLAAAEIIEEFGFSPEREIFYMSRGERQMLALASVLVRRPKILIADEPTSGLDRRQYEFVAERLKEARRRGATVLMVTHDMELAEELADDMLIIGGGAVRAHGPAAGLLSDRRLMEDSSLRLTEMRELAALLGGDFANAGSVNEIVETVKDKRKRKVA